MQVVRGKRLVDVGAGEVDELLSRHARVAVDVGTGDGRLPYALARERPDTLAVGIDVNADNLRETSLRALRKPSRGGLPNVLFAIADAEHPPAELAGRADEVHVILPWGKLMVGLLRADPGVLGGLAVLAKPGASLHVVLNGEVWADPVPVEARDLPDPTVGYVDEVLAPAYRRAGIVVEPAREMAAEAIRAMASTWAKRLQHGRPHPRFVEIDGAFAPVREPAGPGA